MNLYEKSLSYRSLAAFLKLPYLGRRLAELALQADLGVRQEDSDA